MDCISSLIYLDPPAPTPWPVKPLFDKPLFNLRDTDRFDLEDMLLNLLETVDLELPIPAAAANKCTLV